MDPDGSKTGRVIRATNGQVVQIITQYFNAPSVVTEGIDFAANYPHRARQFRRHRRQSSATYVPVYRWQLTPGGASENYAGEENQGPVRRGGGEPEMARQLQCRLVAGEPFDQRHSQLYRPAAVQQERPALDHAQPELSRRILDDARSVLHLQLRPLVPAGGGGTRPACRSARSTCSTRVSRSCRCRPRNRSSARSTTSAAG